MQIRAFPDPEQAIHPVWFTIVCDGLHAHQLSAKPGHGNSGPGIVFPNMKKNILYKPECIIHHYLFYGLIISLTPNCP